MKLTDLATLSVGSPQFRIKESNLKNAAVYKFYDQTDLEVDLTGAKSETKENKQIRTVDNVTTLKEGNIIFSFISGKASIVKIEHAGYLYTQNYVVIQNSDNVDPGFLVYLLNEDKTVAHQFRVGLQGSIVLKYTVKQLRELKLPKLPLIEKQKAIGEVYLKQLRLQMLRERVAKHETMLRWSKLEEANNNE